MIDYEFRSEEKKRKEGKGRITRRDGGDDEQEGDEAAATAAMCEKVAVCWFGVYVALLLCKNSPPAADVDFVLVKTNPPSISLTHSHDEDSRIHQ